jgi:histidyl-tRNA synthetase
MIKAVKGTRDILPPSSAIWNQVESIARQVFRIYNYQEIRTPILEETALFARGVGQETDIVSKEMYTFDDRDGSSLTLRPEATASVMRAYIEHRLDQKPGLQKLYYIGPMFRRERPQKGRYRQFYQIGAEAIGSESPSVDAEVIEMVIDLLRRAGLEGFQLLINSVGDGNCRPQYVTLLKEKLLEVASRLCGDCQRRVETNPLRVLDCKVAEDQATIDGLPKIAEFLDEASTAHFAQVCAALDACGVPYRIEPRLVRGLDYYTRTTFEFTAVSGLGTQNALLGGGRYDGLSEMLGGPKAPGIGFAIGEDRLILTLQALAAAAETDSGAAKLDVYIAPLGVGQNAAALALARELRGAGLSVEVGDGSFRVKKSFELADKLARRIVLLGEDEVASGVLTVKSFASGEQTKIARAELVESCRAQA